MTPGSKYRSCTLGRVDALKPTSNCLALMCIANSRLHHQTETRNAYHELRPFGITSAVIRYNRVQRELSVASTTAPHSLLGSTRDRNILAQAFTQQDSLSLTGRGGSGYSEVRVHS